MPWMQLDKWDVNKKNKVVNGVGKWVVLNLIVYVCIYGEERSESIHKKAM